MHTRTHGLPSDVTVFIAVVVVAVEGGDGHTYIRIHFYIRVHRFCQ